LLFKLRDIKLAGVNRLLAPET